MQLLAKDILPAKLCFVTKYPPSNIFPLMETINLLSIFEAAS